MTNGVLKEGGCMSNQTLLQEPQQNNYMPLNSSWLEFRDGPLTEERKAEVRQTLLVESRCSFQMLKANKADAVLLGVPEQKFWAWLQGEWEPS